MTEINKINPAQFEPKVDNKKQAEIKPGFEQELLKTVEKLENIGQEIDNMMTAGPEAVSSEVNKVGDVIHSMEMLMEKIAPENANSNQSAKFVASRYEQSQNDSNGS